MTYNEVVNEVNEHIKAIILREIKPPMTKKTEDSVRNKVREYLIQVSETMGFVFLPEVKAEYDGFFLSVNFLDERGERLETFGDLIYYMDTGENNTRRKNELLT